MSEKIDFTIDDLSTDSAYWIKINRMADSKKPANIKGSIAGGVVIISIDNVSSFEVDLSLQMKDCHLKANEIIVRKDEKVLYSGKFPEKGKFVYNGKTE